MATPAIPVVQREEGIQSTPKPDAQGAFQEVANSQNLLSTIGARVAQSASNQMAVTLGTETGKTPHGDLLPPVTEFDKNFADSYHQQASSTLQIQGQKLLEDTQVEMAKAQRLTPGLIARTQAQLQSGLNKIADTAPTAIKGNLKAQFDSQVLQHTTQYNQKMIGQQREDEKNALTNGIGIDIKNAGEAFKNGDIKGGTLAVEAAQRKAGSGQNSRYFTPEQARLYKETAIQAGLDGQFIHQATEAQKEGKLSEFEKNYADKKLPGMEKMTNEQHLATGQAVATQMNFLQSLRAQQDNLEISKFNVHVALNPNNITGSDIEKLRAEVSPEKFEEAHLSYIKAMRAFNRTSGDSQVLLNNWGDPRAHAATTAQVIDKTYENQVSSYQQKGVPVQDAEVLVASAAGGVVPEFTRSLHNRMASSNPAMIESAAQQIHSLNEMQKGNALAGLSQEDMAMFHAFQSVRDSADPVKAAQEAHDRIYNKGNEEVVAAEANWSNQLTVKKPTGMSLPDYGLTVAGIADNKYLSPGDKTLYGNDLLDEYKSNFIASGGDDKSARLMLQQSVKNNYGYTNVNGIQQFTKHPIEQVLNLPDNADVVVQQDVYNQLGKHFEANKKAYDAGQVNEYWELSPRASFEEIKKQQTDVMLPKNYFKNDKDVMLVKDKEQVISKPIEVIKHTRNGGIGEKYTIMIKSNPFATTTTDPNHPTKAGWDLAVNNEAGVRNLARIAPYLGVITYDPDIAYIKSTYAKLHPLK